MTTRVFSADSDAVGQFLRSARAADSALTPTEDIPSWLAGITARTRFSVERISFTELSNWHFEETTGNLRHDSGRFFSVEGLHVRTDRRWRSSWTQPVIVQPEIGILGILVKEFDGILHCLMQAKMEPGNVNTVQLSPTVQATRTNYTGVHKGSAIQYLDHFTGGRHRVLVDVLQSEQGAWFLHKRNRNMVVEALDDVPIDDDRFRWLTIGQIRRLLAQDNVVNMDARTVLSCIPTAFSSPSGRPGSEDSFAVSVLRSLSGVDEPLHGDIEVLSWLTDVRARQELVQRRVPLNNTMADGWYRTPAEIAHQDGTFFKVVAVDVQAHSREVTSWTQPLIAPTEPGLLAFLVRRINGVLHVLVQARADAGSLNGAELAPTVHCQPNNHRALPPAQQPAYLGYVLSAPPSQIRYDVVQSEEGGRFYHAQNRYLVVEVDGDLPEEPPAEYRWMTLGQLTGLLVHSNYLNVEARSLIACIQTLW